MDVPTVCPVCGAYSMTHDQHMSALLAVCDVLCLKALESLGKWVVRADRSRFKVMDGQPYHLAHTRWQPTDHDVDKALRGAWDVIPALLDNYGAEATTLEEITAMLDSYVHDLAITGTRHTVAELQYRMVSRLRLPVYSKDDDHGPLV